MYKSYPYANILSNGFLYYNQMLVDQKPQIEMTHSLTVKQLLLFVCCLWCCGSRPGPPASYLGSSHCCARSSLGFY